MSNTGQGTMSLGAAIVRGTIGFTVVSLAGFAVWAFGGRWFYRTVGEAGLYVACAIVFLGLAGPLMHRLVAGPRSMARFYKLFLPAFIAYAVVWSVCWFVWGFGKGEWLGSLLGCAVFVIVLAATTRNWRRLWLTILVLFVLHTVGYFAGDLAYKFLNDPETRRAVSVSKSVAGMVAKFAWGFFYGLGFGAGIGYAFHAVQQRPENRRA